ncbi:MAG: hypothetical protein HOP19_15260 [Acidobacteria bacterium]|nr:hypothetical protein [Acidobacteriota bacterium]
MGLEESVIYQDIFQKGYQLGLREVEGKIFAGIVESRLRVSLPRSLHQLIEDFSVDGHKEALSALLFEVNSIADLARWRRQYAAPQKRIASTQSANKNGFASAKKKSN